MNTKQEILDPYTPWTIIYQGPLTTFPVYNLTTSTAMRFRVKTESPSGVSEWSPIVRLTTLQGETGKLGLTTSAMSIVEGNKKIKVTMHVGIKLLLLDS